MQRCAGRVALTIFTVVVLVTIWLPVLGDGGASISIAQGQAASPGGDKPLPTATRAPSPAPTPSNAAAPGAGAATAGTASAGAAGHVQGQGSTQPPPLTAEQLQLIRERMNQANRTGPRTPIDASAPVSFGRPTAPKSAPSAAAPGGATAAPGTFQYYQDADLGAGNASIIAEPSQGMNRLGTILETWNWYSGISTDAGTAWTYYSPFTMFPASYGGFCCDQSVYYDSSRDLMIWVLQYSQDSNNNNTLRLAVANGPTNLATASFSYWDLTPQQIGAANGTYYDQPKLSRSDNNLFLEATQYGATSGSAVLRLPLDTLASGGTLVYRYYLPGLFSPGFSQGATTTMYFAAHVSTSTVRVFSWADSATTTTAVVLPSVHVGYLRPPSTPTASSTATAAWDTHSEWRRRAEDSRRSRQLLNRG